MTWFLNKYRCERCGGVWSDEWSSACDDDCRKCGARHMSPFDSEDLSEIIVPSATGFQLLCSADGAEDDPEYASVRTFATRAEAEAFIARERRPES